MARKVAVVMLLIWMSAWLFSEGPDREPMKKAEGWMGHRFIAHALGGIDGFSYTNSHEAFISNYRKGSRLFEVDLLLTSDGNLAARHDWSDNLQKPADEAEGPLSLSQFVNSPVYGKFRPLSLDDLLQLMRRYTDIYLITDTKETDPAKVKEQFEYLVAQSLEADPSLLKRIVPEIYNEEMYQIVMDIYPFPHKIYSLYQNTDSAEDVLAFIYDKDFSAVAMPIVRAVRNAELISRLNEKGINIYVHTVNSGWLMNLLHNRGVYGFYTDSESTSAELLDNLTNSNTLATAALWLVSGAALCACNVKMKRRIWI